jgi:glucokinase
MNGSASAIIGIDLGATTIAAGLVTPGGEVLHALQRPTHRDGRGTALAALLGLVQELLTDARAQGRVVEGIGIGVAGIVDSRTGTMRPHPHNHLPELANVSLVEAVRAVSGLPVFVDNDANALALAEWMFGVGRGTHSLVLVAIGTAIGGGIVLADTLVRGARGAAGELHGIPVNVEGRACFCGARGCLGAYVEGRSIVAEARDRLAAGAPSSLPGLIGGDPARLTPELVFQAGLAGDPLAKAIVDGVCQSLGAAMAFIVNTLDPEVVVVTGGVARSLVPLADEVRRCAASHTVTAAALPAARIHVIPGDKRQTVRGGAALMLYETREAAPHAHLDGRG